MFPIEVKDISKPSDPCSVWEDIVRSEIPIRIAVFVDNDRGIARDVIPRAVLGDIRPKFPNVIPNTVGLNVRSVFANVIANGISRDVRAIETPEERFVFIPTEQEKSFWGLSLRGHSKEDQNYEAGCFHSAILLVIGRGGPPKTGGRVATHSGWPIHALLSAREWGTTEARQRIKT